MYCIMACITAVFGSTGRIALAWGNGGGRLFSACSGGIFPVDPLYLGDVYTGGAYR